MNNILTQNKLVKNLRAYPVLRKRWRGYIRGVRALPEGFTEDKLFHDYLRVRRSNPEKRVSMSEYMIFGFYGLTTAQQKQYLTDVEATLLMRPYNSIAEPYLKSKVTFLKNFSQFVSRGWLYLPESDPEAFDAFVHRYHVIALKPQYSSWGIGFRKLTEAEWDAAPDRQALFDELCAGKYLAEEFVQSDESLARFHPASLNTLRVITFRRGDRFEVFGAGLRVGNNGRRHLLRDRPGHRRHHDRRTRRARQQLPLPSDDRRALPGRGDPAVGGGARLLPQRRADAAVSACRRLGRGHFARRQAGAHRGQPQPIVQAPAKHGVHDKFAHMLLDFYGDPAQYACETEKRP